VTVTVHASIRSRTTTQDGAAGGEREIRELQAQATNYAAAKAALDGQIPDGWQARPRRLPPPFSMARKLMAIAWQ